MSDDTHARSAYAHVPTLTKDNYPLWALRVKAYLAPNDHGRVICREFVGLVEVDPIAPSPQDAGYDAWVKSEQVASGLIIGTAADLHFEICHAHERSPAWDLWVAIENCHIVQDASLRYDAWMGLFAVRKAPGETYCDMYRRIETARSKIVRVTPPTLTITERFDEIALFTGLNAMPPDDPLRSQLTSQGNLTLKELYLTFLRTDRNIASAVAIESANAAYVLLCHCCDEPGHLAKDCPYINQFRQLVTRMKSGNNSNNANNSNNSNNKGWGNRGRGKGRGSANAASTSDTHSNSTNAQPASNNTSAAQQESAGVSTSLPILSSSADRWLSDTGATCSMSRDRRIFSSLGPDRRPIRLADGKAVYSEGVGSVRFLSSCGYVVIVNDVLFVPSLSVSLFSPNRFARAQRDTYTEVTEYPTRKWVNKGTGAVEFTATIGSDDLAYLDWKPILSSESASVSVAEMHARLNHMPFNSVRQLIRAKSIEGVPDGISTSGGDDFCEDCVNGKLTRAPHTKAATRATRPLSRVFSDVHGPLTVRSRHGHFYWVTFVDDFSRFPAVYFITHKSDVLGAFRKFKAWAENATGYRIGALRDDKGSEYMSGAFESFLADAGIQREHTIRDTPQQNGVAERLNRSISEGITTLLSQSGLSRTWWEDAATHWLYGKIRLPGSATAPLTPYDLFYGRRPNLSALRPFGCLSYVHLQKDQRPALGSHALQCVLIGYPTDYKGWKFWDPSARKEIISDSVVFRESVFPFRKSSLSGVGLSSDLEPPATSPIHTLPPSLNQIPPSPILPPAVHFDAPPTPSLPSPVAPPAPPPPAPPLDLPERPRTPAAVKNLTSFFEHHPSLDDALPEKCHSRARCPGALAEAHTVTEQSDGGDSLAIPLVDAVEWAFLTSDSIEPRTLADALKRADADKWVAAALAEIDAHVRNGTWVLTQLPPGRRAIGSRWVFKVKRLPDGSIDKYKGRIVAQGFSQVQGVHYNEVFAPTARMAAVRTVIAIAATEDLELETVDISTAFLNGDIDAEIYMKIPEGLEVDGEPLPGEDPKRWVVRLLKGLYGIKQGPRIWSLKLHSVLTSIGFERTSCDYSVYVYHRDGVRIFVPIHVDDLLIASNSKSAIKHVKSELSSHFVLHDLGPATSILGIKISRDRSKRTISLSQPGYIESILSDFSMSDCNPSTTPMDEGQKLSVHMSPSTPEEIAEMKKVPYCELIGKLLYLAVATRPDLAYVVGVLCRFVENPGREHWNAAKRVLRYLKGTVHMELVFSPTGSPDLFTTYADADLSGNPDNLRSTGGFAVCVGGAATQWGSRLQPHVSLSSTESEYTTLSKVGCEVMWMRYLFEDLGYDTSRPSPVLVDNVSAIQVAKHPEHQSTMKHVHRAYHWIRDHIERGLISISHVPGVDNPADIFTKPLGRVKFYKFREMLGLRLGDSLR